MWKGSEEQEFVMRRQREKKIQSGQKGDKRFKDEGVAGVQHYQRGDQIEQWRYTCQRSLGRKSQCYERGQGRGAASGVRAAKISEFGEEEL